MSLFAEIGPVTTWLEAAATAIGAGIVTGAFLAASARRVIGQTRLSWGDEARSDGFWGGAWGVFCLSLDLTIRYLGGI
jgi:hypothetical protein